MAKIKCARCGVEYEASEPKCPNCGSVDRVIHADEQVTLKDELKIFMAQHLEWAMYELAQKHCDKARQARSEGNKSKELMYSLGAVVMAALCCEAMINSIGIRYFYFPRGRTELEKEIQRMKRLSWEIIERRTGFAEKWEVIYPVVNPEMEELDEETLREVRWLYNLRNMLVHYKAKPKPLDKLPNGQLPIWRNLTAENAEKAVRLVRTLAEKIRGISPDLSHMILKEDG